MSTSCHAGRALGSEVLWQIYIFLKEGSGEGHAKLVHSVPIAEASKLLSKFAVQFSETGPVIHPRVRVRKESPPKYVVLEVEAAEENSTFPKVGYYIIGGLKPAVCARMFGLVLTP